MSVAKSAPRPPLVFTLFFLSGGCGLVYEVVWVRLFTRVFDSGQERQASHRWQTGQ